MAMLLKEYISTNGIYMVEGYLFNWEGQNKYGRKPDDDYPLNVLQISLSGENWASHYINYYVKEKVLSVDGTKFKEEDLESAEKTVMKFVEANKLEIAPLYNKKDQTEFSNLVIIND